MFESTFDQHANGLEQEIQHHRSEKRSTSDEVERHIDNPFVNDTGHGKHEHGRTLCPATQPIENDITEPVTEPEIPSVPPEICDTPRQPRSIVD